MQLEGKQLGFGYAGSAPLFKGVNLNLSPGEIVGIVGPSGCGKTSLGRIMAGFEAPHEGSVTLAGAPLPRRGYRPVQMVLQHPEKAVNPRWRLGRSLREGWSPEDKLLQQLGIEEDWLQRYPNELSGGELQRICIARALGPATRYLIADEMTTMLDAVTQAHIWHMVLQVARERSIGMMVISHDPHLIRRLCDRNIQWGELL